VDLLLISETEIRILYGEGVTVALIVGIAVLTVVADILDMIVCEGKGEMLCTASHCAIHVVELHVLSHFSLLRI
jgi:hypothetical protein